MSSAHPESPARRSGFLGWLRRRGDLLAAVPAVLFGLVTAAVVFLVHTTPRVSVAAHYKEAARRALAARKFEAAKVCYERLAVDLGPRLEGYYGLALSLKELGEKQRAVRLLSEIAPLKGPGGAAGYAPAHLLLARAFLEITPQTTQAIDAARLHLEAAVKVDPDLTDAQAALGLLYANLGRHRDAIDHLLRAVPDHPDLRVALARCYQARGMTDEARQEANQAIKDAERRAKTSVDARITLADGYIFLQKFPEARDALTRGEGNWRGEPRLRSGLAVVYALWADSLAPGPGESDDENLGKRLAVLQEGLEADPSCAPLLDRFAQILRAGGPRAEKTRERLRDLLAQGKATATVHFTLGVDAWLRGKTDEARLHFEEADRLEPGNPIVANNLATILVRTEPADPKRALAIVDLSVEKYPNIAALHGTRGEVLGKLGRWKEALAELETALAADPDNASLHRELAKGYDQLGVSEMAARHRKASEARKPADKGPAPG